MPEANTNHADVGENVMQVGLARPIFDVPITTSEMLYVFCAAAWVIAVDHITTSNITPPTIALLMSTFFFIPFDIYSGTLWSEAARLYVQGRHFRTQKDIALVSFDVMRVFCLTIIFFLLPSINASINEVPFGKYEANYNTAIFLVGMLLVLGFFWNAILFKAKARDWFKYYEDIFNEHRNEVDTARLTKGGSPARDGFYDNFINLFKNINKFMFVYFFPMAGSYLLLSSLVLNLDDKSKAKIAIINFPITLVPSFHFYDKFILFIFIMQSFMKMLHILFLSLMISDSYWARRSA